MRLHWTDTSYVWHANDGAEVFCVLDRLIEKQGSL